MNKGSSDEHSFNQDVPTRVKNVSIPPASAQVVAENFQPVATAVDEQQVCISISELNDNGVFAVQQNQSMAVQPETIVVMVHEGNTSSAVPRLAQLSLTKPTRIFL